MTHTPGPWNTGGVVTRVEVMPQGWRVPQCIADCHTKYAPEDEAERCGNAYLIAAAPDLLIVCRRIMEARDQFAELGIYPADGPCPTGGKCFDDWAADLCEAVIAKARGQQ